MTEANGPGSFVFSLDLELAWGAVHRGSYDGREKDFLRTRYAVDEVLRLLRKYSIKATWAVVGHLFLPCCRPSDGVKHPEIIRSPYPALSGDWFDRDPCADVWEEPYWYAPDIVEKIKSCPVPQEIGCHNFSHRIVGSSGCSKETFASELAASQQAASAYGETLRSFVFPRNMIGHLEVLESHGYRAFRGLAPDWTNKLPGRLRRPARLIDAFIPAGAPTSHPSHEAGMWNIPASYNYLHRSGWARTVPVWVRVRKSVRALRNAARRGTIFHLWTHPFNIASDPRSLIRGLEAIFQEVRTLRDSGLVVNQTMGEIAERLDGEKEFPGKHSVASGVAG
jgi:peptidoglycan/xylan/chitin deacetylase (PgdA/CDA1 family)